MIKDGGSAFPHGFNEVHHGMTLRDYFAAKAMQAVMTNEAFLTRLRVRNGGDTEAAHKDLAFGCYAMADTMLAEREKGGK